MYPLLIGGIALIALLLGKNVGTSMGNDSKNSGASFGPSPLFYENPWKLPDIDQTNQQGGFSQDYDSAYEKASGQTKVPFALIKAHALRESAQNPNAYHFDNSSVGASYGLLQVEWVAGSARFEKYGYSDDQIGDGSLLYDPEISAYLGACIIRDNLYWLKGNLRDSVNAYNTGHAESKGAAPGHYTDDVLAYYAKILGVGFTEGGSVS